MAATFLEAAANRSWLVGSGRRGACPHKQAGRAGRAAMTYVDGALASLGQLFYYVMQFIQGTRSR